MARTTSDSDLRRRELASLRPAKLLAEADAGALTVFADGNRLVVRGPKDAEQVLV